MGVPWTRGGEKNSSFEFSGFKVTQMSTNVNLLKLLRIVCHLQAPMVTPRFFPYAVIGSYRCLATSLYIFNSSVPAFGVNWRIFGVLYFPRSCVNTYVKCMKKEGVLDYIWAVRFVPQRGGIFGEVVF